MIPSDDFISQAEQARLRKHLHHPVRRAIDNVLAEVEAYVQTVYDLDEAASEHQSSSGMASVHTHNHAGLETRLGDNNRGGDRRVARDARLDSYLRRDVKSDLDSLARSIEYRRNQIVTVLRGGKPRKRLSREQASAIRGRRREDPNIVASEYAVSRQTVTAVQEGKTHREG